MTFMRFLFLFAILFLENYVLAQDTIFVNKIKTKTKIESNEEQNQFEIRNKIFVYSDTGFFSILNFSDLINSLDFKHGIRNKYIFRDDKLIDKTNTLLINSCRFLYTYAKGNYDSKIKGESKTSFPEIWMQDFISDNDLTFDESTPSYFYFDRCIINGDMDFGDNYNGFSFYDSKILGDVQIWNSGKTFGFSNTKIAGDLGFSDAYFNLTISRPEFISNSKLWFDRDTIKGLDIDSLREKVNITFKNCIIDGPINIDFSNSLNISFQRVLFTENAMLSLAADSIIFTNCGSFFTSNVFSYSNKHLTHVYFQNTDFSKLQMEYNNLAFFSKSLNDDELFSMYERALMKFKQEGKKESYKNVDIDYKKHQYSKCGFNGYILNFFDKIWWNYGYNKMFIIYWTLLFVFFFFIINVFNWDIINKSYPIMNDDSNITISSKQKNKIARVFLFTVYIFFSLRVDFGKLKYSNNGILSWFFIQYLTGLICVFFIANAILKIG